MTITISHTVPGVNGALNASINDVIGNKSDDESGDSLYAIGYIIESHHHSVSKVYPTLAAGVTVTAGTAEAWTLGDPVQIVPAATITSPFDIHWITIIASVATTYELVLYAAAVEIGRVRIVRPAGNLTTSQLPMITPLIAAGTAINAKVASATGDANTVTISIGYHTY